MLRRSTSEGALFGRMDFGKVLREHWLLGGTLFCIFWPALLIFSPVYVPPLLLYVTYVKLNQREASRGQDNQTSDVGKGENVDGITTEKHVITPASGARSFVEQIDKLANEQEHKLTGQGNRPVAEEESSTANHQSERENQNTSLSSETPSKFEPKVAEKELLTIQETVQAERSERFSPQDTHIPASGKSAPKAPAGLVGSAAPSKPKIHVLPKPTNVEPPKKAAPVSPRKTPVVPPKKSVDQSAKKPEVAPVQELSKKPVEGSDGAKGSVGAKETEASAKAAVQPLNSKVAPEASKVSVKATQPPSLAGTGTGAEVSYAEAASKDSNVEDQVEEAPHASFQQKQVPALAKSAEKPEGAPAKELSEKPSKGSIGAKETEASSKPAVQPLNTKLAPDASKGSVDGAGQEVSYAEAASKDSDVEDLVGEAPPASFEQKQAPAPAKPAAPVDHAPTKPGPSSVPAQAPSVAASSKVVTGHEAHEHKADHHKSKSKKKKKSHASK